MAAGDEEPIEDKANGPAIMDDLKDAVRGSHRVSCTGNKVARAHAVLAAVRGGQRLDPGGRALVR